MLMVPAMFLACDKEPLPPAELLEHIELKERTSDAAGPRMSEQKLAAVTFARDSIGIRLATSMIATQSGVVIADQLTAPHVVVISSDSLPSVQRVTPNAAAGTTFPRFLDPASRDGAWIGLDVLQNRMIKLTGEGASKRISDVAALPSVFDRDPIAVFYAKDGYTFFGDFADDLAVSIDTTANQITRHRITMPFDTSLFSNPVFRARVNDHEVAFEPNGRRLAIAYKHANRVDFIDLDSRSGHTAIGPKPFSVRVRVDTVTKRLTWEKGNRIGYVGITASGQNVYALYCACGRDERLALEVHVFGWDGRFLRVLSLDRPVYAIAVSPGDDALYAATWTPSEGVVRYRLDAEANRDQQAQNFSPVVGARRAQPEVANRAVVNRL